MTASRLTKMANNKGANFAPWGIPPCDTGGDNDFPTLTLWDLSDKNTYPSNNGRVYIENVQLFQKHIVTHQVKALRKIRKEYPDRCVSPVQNLQCETERVNKRMRSAFALMFHFASSCLFAMRGCMISPESHYSCGPFCACVHTSFSHWAVIFLISLCLAIVTLQ